jgi:hypothetical protein
VRGVDRTHARRLLTRVSRLAESVWQLMTDCWRTRPDERPTFEALFDRLQAIHSVAAAAAAAVAPISTVASERNDAMAHRGSNRGGIEDDVGEGGGSDGSYISYETDSNNGGGGGGGGGNVDYENN